MKRLRKDSRIIDKKAFWCPQCNKYRLIRPLDHVVSQEKREYKTFKGDLVKLHVDICDFCVERNKNKYFEPSAADIRSFLKAMKEITSEDSDVSLEDML